MNATALGILEALPEGIMVVDADVRIAWASPTAARLFGHDVDELTGRPVVELLHPDDQALAMIGFSTLKPDETTPEVDLRIHRHDGSWGVVSVRASNRLDHPEIAGLVVSVRENSPALADSAVSNDRLRTMLDTSSDLTLLLDRDGDIRWASAAATRLLGHLRREVIGRPLSTLVHPDDHDAFDRIRFGAGSVGGGRSIIDARLADREGEWRRFELHVTNRVEDPTIDGIILSARDVTRLRDTENLLWQAIEKAQLGVLEIDADGVILSANDALTRLVGEPSDALTGRELGEALDEPERERFERELALLRSGLVEVVRTELRWPDQAQTDQAPWLSLRVSRVSSDSSAPPRLMVFATDVTVQKRNATRSQAERQALVRESNHDPLTAVLNRRGLLQRIRPILERSALSGETLALLFVDLDDFKAINDRFGHQVGDVVLAEVASRLADGVRAGDVVGRYGGDEFVVMARVADLHEAQALAHRLAGQIIEPLSVGSESRTINASIGIALNEHTTSMERLLHEADAAMYRQKRSRQTSKGSERT